MTEHGKPLVKPSKKNTHAFLEKVRGIIDVNKSVSQTVLIGLLTPVIRGWVNYHLHRAAKETFNRVDHEIWRALWQWARRRHPKKSRDWAQNGSAHPGRPPVWMRLMHACEIKIRRHVKIRRDANPFDPQWKPYFKDRAFHKSSAFIVAKAGINPS